jgi:acetone carboxylase gamma subunit
MPGCGELLEVEAVPPGCPILFDFLPDLDALEGKRTIAHAVQAKGAQQPRSGVPICFR